MTTLTTEGTGAARDTAASAPEKATKKASIAKRVRHVAPRKAKAGKKATSANKGPKARKKAEPRVLRDGSMSAKILDLLKRPGGATAKELMKATGWQAHSVRGFLSGTVGKKMGLTIESAKSEAGERTYKIVK